jgi:hypothetical protein
VQIFQALPIAFPGSTTTTAYFLMQTVGAPGPFASDETNAKSRASLKQAEDLGSLTTISIGRTRDRAVLDAVRAALESGPNVEAAPLSRQFTVVRPIGPAKVLALRA